MNTPSPTSGSAADAIPKGRVAFVGVGPGDPGLLTLRAGELLGAADVIVHGPEPMPEFINDFAAAGASFVAVPKPAPDRGSGVGDAMAAGSGIDFAAIGGSAVSGAGDPGPGHSGQLLVVRLCGEDPASWRRLGAEIELARGEGFDIEVVPGVSSVSSVPAYVGVPLNAERASAVFASWGEKTTSADVSGAASSGVSVVATGSGPELTDGFGSLLEAGRDPATPVTLTENTATVRQHTVVTTLENASGLIGSAEFGDHIAAVISENIALRDGVEWFESRPLFGWCVLVPRTKDQAGGTVARLAEYGAIGEVVPTISVEPPRTPQQIRRAINGLVTGRYQWVAFTSVNAVRAVRERLAEVGLDSRALAGVKVASVGGVTSTALRDWGVESDLMPESDHSSRGLVDAWPAFDSELDPIDRVFLPRADIATDTLVEGLRELGWDPEDVTAYRTVRAAPPPAPTREAIKKGHFDAVLFTSSSTVRNLIGIAGKPHPSTVVACIGDVTARTAEELGLVVSVVAPSASTETLVDALAGFGRERAARARAEGRAVSRPSERKDTSRRG